MAEETKTTIEHCAADECGDGRGSSDAIPVFAYKHASAFDPADFSFEPGAMIPCDDPALVCAIYYHGVALLSSDDGIDPKRWGDDEG
jgi:hypothetical protein